MKHPDKPFTLVVWDDAYGSADQEQREDEISHEPARFQSYGWAIRSNEKGVTLAAEYSPKANSYRAVMFIPRPMILDEQVLSLARKPKRRDRVPVSSSSSVRTLGVGVPTPDGELPK